MFGLFLMVLSMLINCKFCIRVNIYSFTRYNFTVFIFCPKSALNWYSAIQICEGGKIMKKSFMKKLSLLLAVAVFLTTIAFGFSTNAEAATTRAKSISIAKESQITLLKGGYYTLKPVVTPAKSTDYIRFVSSNPSVVKVNLYTGKLQAIKPGTATITVIAKATKATKNSDKANVKDSVVVKVVSNYATTSTWTKTLVNLPGSGTVKLSSKQAVKITTPSGDFSNKYLVVNAPEGHVVNNGLFKSISVYGIKDSTYYENAKGNTLHVFDKETRFVITDQASVKALNLNAKNGTLRLIANGPVQALNVTGAANTVNLVANSTLGPVALTAKSVLNISGKANSVEVNSSAEGSTITSSVPVALTVSASTEVVLNAGAENSSIVSNLSAGATVQVTNNTTAVVTITAADGTKTDVKAGATVTVSKDAVVTPTPTPTTIPGGGGGGTGGGGGGTNPTPTPTPTTVKAEVNGNTATYTLPVEISRLQQVVVKITGVKDYTVNKTVLNYVNNLLSDSKVYINAWIGIEKHTVNQDLDSKKITITGVAGEMDKKVEFDGVTYDVTLNADSSIDLKKVGGEYTYTLSKGEDDKTLYISCSNPERLKLVEFVVTYK